MAVLAAEQAAIVAALTDHKEPMPPGYLIREMVARGFKDSDIRAALWYLIDFGQLRLTGDFNVALPAAD